MNPQRRSAADPVALTAVTDATLTPTAYAAAVLTENDGAMVTFVGVVRDRDHDRAVAQLDYHAHPNAEDQLAIIVADVSTEHPGCRFAVAHRHGTLAVGDTAIIAAVASPHRAEAFNACAAVVDAVKHRLPMWKHQHFVDGSSEWVNCA